TTPPPAVISAFNNTLRLVWGRVAGPPWAPLDGDPHLLRPERDYPVWRHRLPEGYVTLDSVEINFAG
ncbi:MAG: hypothetical protein VX877_05335, partial [Planctomycetota bacterium]|nr:hypothetical protein [Planctomycetota bacterium]